MSRLTHLVVFGALGLTAAACDSSSDDLSQLAGTYTLTIDGFDDVQGRAAGSTNVSSSSPPYAQIFNARPVYDIPVVGGARFDFNLSPPAQPGVYRISPSRISGDQDGDGCGGSESGGSGSTALGSLFLSVAGSQRTCAATILGGEVEVFAATETDTRFRFSFAAVPAFPVGLPDTVRASGTFTLALDLTGGR